MNTRRTCTLIVALASLFALPALFAQESAAASIKGQYRQEGIASWYGAEFEGRLTASGEAFVSAGLTAAHPSLPFGTLVRVTNRHNGKSVVVRINDRGPFVAARIIDVSRGAAEVLDMIVTGTAPVIVESDVAIPGVAAAPAASTSSEAAPASVPEDTGARVENGATEAVPTAAESVPAVTTIEKAPAAPAIVEYPDTWANEKGDPGMDSPAMEAVELPAAPAAPEAPPVAITEPVAEAVPTLPPARVLPQLPDPKNGKFYRIQVGSYKVERFAALAFDKLEKASFVPAYERYLDMYRVVIPMVSSDKVEWYAKQLGQLGFREVLIRQER